MVTFPLTHHGYKERIARFLESGAPPPDGVTILGRWFTSSHSRGFMVVETEEAKLLFKYTSEWADIMDLEIYPVVEDEEAGEILQGLAQG